MALAAGFAISTLDGVLYAWSAFMLPLEQATAWTRSQTSLVFTAILVFFGLGMISGGFVVRHLGARATAAAGTALLGLGMLLSSLADRLWHLLISYGMAAGFGIGISYIVTMAVAVSWFPRQRGIVCGLLAFGLSLGTLLFGSWLVPMLLEDMDVFAGLRLLGITVLLAGPLIALFLKMPPALAAAGPETGLPGSTTLEMIKTWRFQGIWIWALAIQAGGLTIIGNIVPYALDAGIAAGLAAATIGIYAIGNGLGRLFFGTMYDVRGFRQSMVFNSLCMLAGLAILLFLPRLWGFWALCAGLIMVAMSCGGSMPQFCAFIAQNFGPAHLESNLGITSTAVIAAGFLGPMVSGWLYSLTGGYATSIALIAVLVVPGMFIAVRMQDIKTGR